MTGGQALACFLHFDLRYRHRHAITFHDRLANVSLCAGVPRAFEKAVADAGAIGSTAVDGGGRPVITSEVAVEKESVEARWWRVL